MMFAMSLRCLHRLRNFVADVGVGVDLGGVMIDSIGESGDRGHCQTQHGEIQTNIKHHSQGIGGTVGDSKGGDVLLRERADVDGKEEQLGVVRWWISSVARRLRHSP